MVEEKKDTEILETINKKLDVIKETTELGSFDTIYTSLLVLLMGAIITIVLSKSPNQLSGMALIMVVFGGLAIVFSLIFQIISIFEKNPINSKFVSMEVVLFVSLFILMVYLIGKYHLSMIIASVILFVGFLVSLFILKTILKKKFPSLYQLQNEN
ncbi:MAG: hypothetical protein NTX24_02640 [Candidatus Pacearchaeota archaeon]|nr:hypothetical protein [Candidatus Pacearchaeota archaeon]